MPMPPSAAWPQSYTGAFTQIIRTVCGMSKPPITVSSLDLERLETLLETPAGASFPGRAQLQAELDRAEIVEPADMPPHVVTMHSTVKFSIHETGKDFCLTLVYPRDAGKRLAGAFRGRRARLAGTRWRQHDGACGPSDLPARTRGRLASLRGDAFWIAARA